MYARTVKYHTSYFILIAFDHAHQVNRGGKIFRVEQRISHEIPHIGNAHLINAECKIRELLSKVRSKSPKSTLALSVLFTSSFTMAIILSLKIKGAATMKMIRSSNTMPS